MKNLLALFCLIFFSFSCSSKKETKAAIGPLEGIQNYQVLSTLFTSKNPDKAFEQLVEILKELGEVQISTQCVNDIPSANAILFLSASEREDTKTGCMKVIVDAQALTNNYKTSCEVWATTFYDPTLPYPSIEENGVVFEQDESAKSPTMETVIAEMVTQFAAQFKHDNPGSKPAFQIYKQMLGIDL